MKIVKPNLFDFLRHKIKRTTQVILPKDAALILAPLAATLVQLAVSRTREFAADRSGGIISKKPLSLASALEKISQVAKQHPLQGNAATSHLFIINPFKADMIANLFSTHPPVSERTKRLKELAKEL